MLIADLARFDGRSFPARRLTKNLVNGASPIQTPSFSLGYVELEPMGGQVPWHNHEQEEVYVILSGEGEMCIGTERQRVVGGQTMYIPPNIFHQLTNIGETPLAFIYCYAPGTDVAHWRQELDGTLPKAGIDAPALPDGAYPQHTKAE